MCGIAGVLYADPHRPVDASTLKAMGDAIAHRGPDAEGFLRDPGLGLVHRRLSIIDLSTGDQPIGNEDGSVQIVFNGEIYNFESIREWLLTKGHVFRTRSDTEVLVHLYEEEGERLVERLRGMFAFAIWDRRRRRLLLGRDRIGIKPLYIYRDAEKLIFGSELKAILAHPDVDRRLDLCALEDYLAFGMVQGPRSIFASAKKLQPAHVLSVSHDALQQEPRRYWQLRFDATEGRTDLEWIDAVRAKVDEAVKLHMIADVPVGAFLSGGVDSSLVVASASRSANGPLRTFSIGFEERGFSELPYARQVAERYGTQHVEEVATPDAVELLDKLVFHYDEPFADSSALPTFIVSRLAAKHVKVALSGDGGDEAFGGYPRYAEDLKETAIRRALPAWFRHGPLAALAGVWPKADWLPRPLRAKTLLTNLSLEAGDAYANSLALCRMPLRRQLLCPDVRREIEGHRPDAAVHDAHATAPADDPIAGMIAADTLVRLPDDYLVKVDRASMAYGLESRPPLLDHEVLELAAGMPSTLKVREGETKWVLKQAFADDLPTGITTRAKHGFEIPVDIWLRGPLREMVESTVLPAGGLLAGLVNPDAARALFRRHLAGTGRHGATLWSLLVLARWMDRYA
jgi:asparagine synthase (glutamine-hydrolysing)